MKMNMYVDVCTSVNMYVYANVHIHIYTIALRSEYVQSLPPNNKRPPPNNKPRLGGFNIRVPF